MSVISMQESYFASFWSWVWILSSLTIDAVQWLHQHHLRVPADCRSDHCCSPWQHAGCQRCGEGQGDAMVGAVPDIPRGQQERRVLHPALQPQQVLPTILSKSFQSPGTASRVPTEKNLCIAIWHASDRVEEEKKSWDDKISMPFY